MAWLDRIPFWMVLLAIATLGLAPLTPEPHIWEKLKMLSAGTLTRPIDIFDLAFHALPWLVGIAKVMRSLRLRSGPSSPE